MTAADRPAGPDGRSSRGGPHAGGVSLRAMRWWDLDAVIALEQELFPEDAWSRGMFWSELAEARHPGGTRTYVVAEDGGGRIVGYAGLAAVAGTGDVQTIATARDHWGTGLGSALLTALLRAATAAECHEVLLEVRVDNERAQRLYRRFGFEPIGIRRGYYQPGNVDALVMRLADPAPGAAAPGPVRDRAGGTEATGGAPAVDAGTAHGTTAEAATAPHAPEASAAPAADEHAPGDEDDHEDAEAADADAADSDAADVQETGIHG